ncbi:MAG TPA: hypothetical protein DIV40_05895 [Clostridiales bacterium]|nr:hypothetical protein [Clostridiales bacterium]
MKGNQYLLSIVEVSRQYNIPRDKLYSESRKKTTEIPFIVIGSAKKIHVPLLEKLLTEKAMNKESLFK